uniref:G protein subunit alpha 15 n=1 Tax=Ovis aries TaxID=9940 RepID=A0AC11ES40_SHEEP
MARSLTWRCCPWCLTEDEKSAARIDQEINKILLEQKKRDRGELKLLLLGPGESGKSTFIKQMRIIHGAGYSEEDRKNFRPLVYQNIFISMRTMIEAMERLQIPFSWPESKHHASVIMSQDPYKVTKFEKRHAVAMKWLWEDSGIRACYERRREFHLLDSAVYYLSNLDRITEEGYIPTAQDVLRSRMPTTGINEYCFSVQKTNLRIVDVGGQKSERKKWIHCFENVIALIYLASLSEYDQCLEENNQEVRCHWGCGGAVSPALLTPWPSTEQESLLPLLRESLCVWRGFELHCPLFCGQTIEPQHTDPQVFVRQEPWGHTHTQLDTQASRHTTLFPHPEAQCVLSWECVLGVCAVLGVCVLGVCAGSVCCPGSRGQAVGMGLCPVFIQDSSPFHEFFS